MPCRLRSSCRGFRYPGQAVDRFRQNLRAAGLAGATGACEQVSVTHAPAYQLGFQGLSDRQLARHIIEGLRTVFPIQCLISRHKITPFQNRPAHNKIAHPHLNEQNIRDLRSQLKNGNLSGTREDPLNAAWFPT